MEIQEWEDPKGGQALLKYAPKYTNYFDTALWAKNSKDEF